MQHMCEVLASHIGGISSYDLGHTHYCTAYVRSLSVVRKRFNEVSLSRAMTALFVGKIISFLDEPPPRPPGAAIATPVAELRAAPARWRGSRLSSTSHHHL